MIRDPATGAAITVIRPAPGGPGPLSEARLLASGPHQSYPGYHQDGTRLGTSRSPVRAPMRRRASRRAT